MSKKHTSLKKIYKLSKTKSCDSGFRIYLLTHKLWTSVRMGASREIKELTWSKSREEKYYQIYYLAMTARAIAGGVESPLQLTFQVSHIIRI